MRAAHREHPKHFSIVANLGTAWQTQGELAQAAESLQEAVRLAPGKLQKAEELQLKLVRLRQRQPRDAQDLDDLFGLSFVGDQGTYARASWPAASVASFLPTRLLRSSAWPFGYPPMAGFSGNWRN